MSTDHHHPGEAMTTDHHDDDARYWKARAEKAEAERDGWQGKHAALRADVERMSHDDGPVISNKVAADGAKYILDSDDERDPQPKHEHSWTRHQNVTTSGHEMPPYETCPCGQARPVREADPDTVTLRREGLTEPDTLRLAAVGMRRNYRLGANGLPKSLPATLDALADAMEADQ